MSFEETLIEVLSRLFHGFSVAAKLKAASGKKPDAGDKHEFNHCYVMSLILRNPSSVTTAKRFIC